MRAPACLFALLLFLPLCVATTQEDPAGDVQVTHAVGAFPAGASPYAQCAQPAADVLAVEGGAVGGDFRLAMTLAGWGTDASCPVPMASTAEARVYTVVAASMDMAAPMSRITLFWSVNDGRERVTPTMTFRDGADGWCDGGAATRDGTTLVLTCPLAGSAMVHNQPRAYDLRGISWTYAGQTNLANGMPGSTVRFHDETSDVRGAT